MGLDAGTQGGEWALTDLGSRHGTSINGRRLSAGEWMPLQAGDLIAIAPWMFRLEDPAQPLRSTITLTAVDDGEVGRSHVATVLPRGLGALAQQRLTLLLQCAEAIQGVRDEAELAGVVLDAALVGTGYANAAIMHPAGEDGQVLIVDSRGAILQDGRGPQISRSLVRQAGNGEPARLSRPADATGVAQSIVDLAIEEALCVPILLESTVVLLLYLDDRQEDGRGTQKTPDAAEFAIGLARLAGLALANLRRLDIERRQARMEAELKAAAEVQRWVMPRRSVTAGPFRCVGESRPGQYVGGDFFDVIPLGDGRLAIAVGDVSGKGVAASILMTAAQGFLHSALRRTGDPAQAVTELNQYLYPRCPTSKFLTLWVGVFDGRTRTLTCVDAGHGYALLEADGGKPEPLSAENSDLVGISADASYRSSTVMLPTAGRLFAISDGFIEQPSAEPKAGEESQQAGSAPAEPVAFGNEGVRACAANLSAGADPVEALFEALYRHAGSTALNDDATAVVVEWGAPQNGL